MTAPVIARPEIAPPCEERLSLSWTCVFAGCGKLRIYEGGRPLLFRHLDICPACDSRVASAPADRAAVVAVIDLHLL